MDKHESINAIKDFMNYCKVTDGIEIKAEVEVYDDTELIHQGLANVYCSYDVGYMQYRVAIIWAFDDNVMRKWVSTDHTIQIIKSSCIPLAY